MWLIILLKHTIRRMKNLESMEKEAIVLTDGLTISKKNTKMLDG